MTAACKRSISRGIAWSVFAPTDTDSGFGTNSEPALFVGLNVRFKRLRTKDIPERFATDTRPMYLVTAIAFDFAVGMTIQVEDDPSNGIFKIVDVTPPPDPVIPTMRYATVVRTN